MTYPKINFQYSFIYDEVWKEWWLLQEKKMKDYPSSKEIINYIKRIKKNMAE
jgi:hypothetical protein